jgi:hypothetical protein
MTDSQSSMLLAHETVARYVRDPGSYGNRRKKDIKQNKPLNIEDIIPFRLFRPMTGELVTSLVRRKFGKEDTLRHGKDIEAIGLVEFDVDSLGVIRSAEDEQQLIVLSDPLENFDSHADMITPCIDKTRFPKQKGDQMDPDLTDELTDLYERLYSCCCSQPKSLKEID